jgi:hypothetical protein
MVLGHFLYHGRCIYNPVIFDGAQHDHEHELSTHCSIRTFRGLVRTKAPPPKTLVCVPLGSIVPRSDRSLGSAFSAGVPLPLALCLAVAMDARRHERRTLHESSLPANAYILSALNAHISRAIWSIQWCSRKRRRRRRRSASDVCAKRNVLRGIFRAGLEFVWLRCVCIDVRGRRIWGLCKKLDR